MDSNNYINLESSVEYSIYRIVSVEKLLEAFEIHKNILVSPGKWDDPFENFILNSKVILPNGRPSFFSHRSHVYAQCWTKNKNSDAMWRIYSPNSNAVRIRTTIPKLASSLYTAVGGASKPYCFIGKVEYLNRKKLTKFASEIFPTSPGDNLWRVFAKSLLVKRLAFRHEKEIRLIYINPGYDVNLSGNQDLKDLYGYSLDPNKLIEQIMVDPRVDDQEYVKIKEKIQEATGFKGKILKSSLYTPPKKMAFSFL